jgi:CheY-like chemotaxis protein
MRIRKLLLVHPSRSIRGLIKKYVYAELSDIEIFEAEGGCQALEQMESQQFDILACTDQLKDMALSALKTRQQGTQSNGNTPFVVISESESAQARNALVEQGFDMVVQIRVRPADLIRKINTLCDPRHWRRDTRYHIPTMRVIIDIGQYSVEAFLINISMGGILVELSTDQSYLLMQNGVDITLQLPMDGAPVTIDGLRGKLLRLELIKWSADLAPIHMRATFMFEALCDEPRNKLHQLIQMAKEDKALATEVRD